MTQAKLSDSSVGSSARNTIGAFISSTQGRVTRPAYKQAETIGTASAPFRITMNGTKLYIEADVDLKGLQLLKHVLKSYEDVLALLEANPDLSPAPDIPDEMKPE